MDKVTIRKEGDSAFIIEPRAPGKIRAKWCCSDCTHEWDQEYDPGTSPFCPQCKSTLVDPITPAVSFFSKKEDNMTLMEQKRARFVKREWRNYLRLEKHIDSLFQMMGRLQVDSCILERVKGSLQEALTFLEKKHEGTLAEFDSRVGDIQNIDNVLVEVRDTGVFISWHCHSKFTQFNVYRCSGRWEDARAERVNSVVLKEKSFFDGPGNPLRVVEDSVTFPRGAVNYRVEGILVS